MPLLIAQTQGPNVQRSIDTTRTAPQGGFDRQAPHRAEVRSQQDTSTWGRQTAQTATERMPEYNARALPAPGLPAVGTSATPTQVPAEPASNRDVAQDVGAQLGSSTETATLASSASSLLDGAKNYIKTRGPDLVEGIVLALIIAYVGNWAARVTFHFLQRVLRRAGVDETLTRFLSRIAQAAVLTFAAIAAMSRLGVETSSVAAVIAAAGLAVGLALQGSLSNFAAGVMLILFRPFSVGDFVEAAGTKGIVEEIHVFHTVMRTPDNVRIIVPNGAITASNISNYSAEPIRRIDLVVGCGYKDDLLAVKQFLVETIRKDHRVRSEPAPVVAVHELGDSSVNFVVRPWVASTDYWVTRWDLTEAIKLGFDAHGFQIPFPQRDLHVHHQSAGAAAAAMTERASGSAASHVPASVPFVHRPSTAAAPAAQPSAGLVTPRRAA